MHQDGGINKKLKRSNQSKHQNLRGNPKREKAGVLLL